MKSNGVNSNIPEITAPVCPKGSRYASADPTVLTEEEAQVLGEEIEKMAKGGFPVTPARIVSCTKDPSTRLYKHFYRHFEWNDSLAAAEHRKTQARTLIQSLEIVTVQRSGPRRVPAQIEVEVLREPEPARQYLSVKKVQADPAAREQVLSRALEELQTWARRYKALGLSELEPVYEVAARYGK